MALLDVEEADGENCGAKNKKPQALKLMILKINSWKIMETTIINYLTFQLFSFGSYHFSGRKKV